MKSEKALVQTFFDDATVTGELLEVTRSGLCKVLIEGVVRVRKLEGLTPLTTAARILLRPPN